jgi:hypothetical protein
MRPGKVEQNNRVVKRAPDLAQKTRKSSSEVLILLPNVSRIEAQSINVMISMTVNGLSCQG